MLEVFITVLIVYIIYYFVSVTRYDKNGHLKKNKNNSKVSDYEGLPNEVKYFIKKYKVDLDKINLRALLKLTGLILGIDIAIVSIVLILIFKDNLILILVIATILLIPLYLISLKILGNYFKKKGLVKNE
ncbi:MAG: hypothetical protein IKP79_00615 [Bacilli bacterium]|nr:hypothetical protein [Bacilli bacterium]